MRTVPGPDIFEILILIEIPAVNFLSSVQEQSITIVHSKRQTY
jgi:hypothetical protein